MDNPICEKYQDWGKAVLWTINCRQLRLWERIRFRHRGTFKQVSTDNFQSSIHHVDDPDDGDDSDGDDDYDGGGDGGDDGDDCDGGGDGDDDLYIIGAVCLSVCLCVSKSHYFCIQRIRVFLLFLDTFRIQIIWSFLLFIDTFRIQDI